MVTPSVLARVTTPQVPRCGCIIWRRVEGCWDFFCRAPFHDAERIVLHDQIAMGLSNADYQVRRG